MVYALRSVKRVTGGQARLHASMPPPDPRPPHLPSPPHSPSPCRVRPLRWYIMTSPATDEETKKHFRAHAFFGLKESQVVFFSQGALPAMTEQGRIIREAPARLAMAPDGNGGVYVALRASGVLADMAAHGVLAVDCYCVDNALVRLGDPLFAGYCHTKGVECGEWVGRWRAGEARGDGELQAA